MATFAGLAQFATALIDTQTCQLHGEEWLGLPKGVSWLGLPQSGRWLMIRACYKRIWSLVQQQLQSAQARGFVITGTPGGSRS